jgi:hypothetical protein
VTNEIVVTASPSAGAAHTPNAAPATSTSSPHLLTTNRTIMALCSSHVARINDAILSHCEASAIQTWSDKASISNYNILLPLFDVGYGTGKGRCPVSNNGVVYNIISSTVVSAEVVSRVLDSGCSVVAGGGVAGGGNDGGDDETCYDAAMSNYTNNVLNEGAAWLSLADRLKEMKVSEIEAENRRLEIQANENRIWSSRQNELRRRNGDANANNIGNPATNTNATNLTNSVGYFPSLIALQYSRIPDPEVGGINEREEIEKRKQLDVIVRVLTVVFIAFFLLA